MLFNARTPWAWQEAGLLLNFAHIFREAEQSAGQADTALNSVLTGWKPIPRLFSGIVVKRLNQQPASPRVSMSPLASDRAQATGSRGAIFLAAHLT